MSILFAGSPSSAAVTLSRLLELGVDISLVLTREDAPIGRSKQLTQTPVADLASQRGIPVVKTNQINERVLDTLRRHRIQIAVVVAYGIILKDEALTSLPNGWYNLHFSILPSYRGAAPVQRAILAGDRETGITLFKIDEGLDTGPIAASMPVLIEPNDTSDSLLSRMSLLGATLIAETLPAITSGFIVLERQVGTPSLAPKLLRGDGLINFSESAERVYNRFRAVTSSPGAWTWLNGNPIKLLSMLPSRETLGFDSGQFVAIEGRVLVQCSQGVIELKKVKPAGKSEMAASEWIKGMREVKKFGVQ